MDNELREVMVRVRGLLGSGMGLKDVLSISQIVPPALVDKVRNQVEAEQSFTLEPPGMLVADSTLTPWLDSIDSSGWLYWQAYKALLYRKHWKHPAVSALDLATQKILGQLADPRSGAFDRRGLVLGHIQSGKTANFTGLIAKAADVGYRLVIVLSGIDNALRSQTNKRLKRELIGAEPGDGECVPLPPLGRRWHEFTSEDIAQGDFAQGRANHAALQGTQPVLLVVKKNAAVLKRLSNWLQRAPEDCKRSLPLLLIDDEADQASIDTRGTAQGYGLDDPEERPEAPSVINGLIREILLHFTRRAYVAYTATPFANVLIPHDMRDAKHGDDLYPRDFIISLPKPQHYFGSEELFGQMDGDSGESEGGLDVIRAADSSEALRFENDDLPHRLAEAIDAFLLAGAAQMHRAGHDVPATMLVHTSQRVIVHGQLFKALKRYVSLLRAEWKHDPASRLRPRLERLWNDDFRKTTCAINASLDAPFTSIEGHISAFLDGVRPLELNSSTNDALDYERTPGLKVIAVGGNKLSRGLTLEGLLTSYFVRKSVMYDTLLQMGRWFGFRAHFKDLIRLYTTAELTSYYSSLAFVEHRIREDIKIYEERGLTPLAVGVRVWQHPELYVTAANKRRFAGTTTASTTYSCDVAQTFRFPLDQHDVMRYMGDHNLTVTRALVSRGRSEFRPNRSGHATWNAAPPEAVLQFLEDFHLDSRATSIDKAQLLDYIRRRLKDSELTRWVVCVRGREEVVHRLGSADWGLPDGPVAQMSRTRLAHGDSLGVITSPRDETIGLEPDALDRLEKRMLSLKAAGKKRAVNVEARLHRSPECGLLLLYPISKASGHEKKPNDARRPLYNDPDHRSARDLIGFAVSFPQSRERVSHQFAIGTVPHEPDNIE